jgi:hypothetical protein
MHKKKLNEHFVLEKLGEAQNTIHILILFLKDQDEMVPVLL